ncbi:OLC1v1037854C1 [Oldenlandia corymbosa var. corymbosa]|uniref:OLC1v1037854C1 n=1 Tax=Oldenlandia corymbosa var. corymbosa TaxID=529605 RepID=A0AAV1CZN9_OLDCO|nr:OLC1v1037854C1 [Oldenlandia corymbosa var. corymbosa]
MDSDASAPPANNAPRKRRFTPKAPAQRRIQKPAVPKVEKVEDGIDAAQAEELLRRFNEGSVKVKPKFERKVGPVRVVFGQASSSTPSGPFAAHRLANLQNGVKVEKDYKEPWDYYTYYPVTLPLRRPYSGNPEQLDKEEFGQASESLTYDECSLKPASDLGLTVENSEENMLFLQLPKVMPMLKQSPDIECNEKAANSKPSKSVEPSQKACNLDELTAGFMGKMYVYRSGAVKLKLGDTIYDVSSGLDCKFAQDVVAVNTEEKHCCVLGELNKRATLTPDVESFLERLDIE